MMAKHNAEMFRIETQKLEALQQLLNKKFKLNTFKWYKLRDINRQSNEVHYRNAAI